MSALTIPASTMPVALRDEVEAAKGLIRARHASSTRRAYGADLLVFKAWADQHGLVALPAAPETIVLFLASQSRQGKRPATIQRRLASIRHLHREAGHPSPTDTEVVAATMSGIRRTAGMAQRQAAPATSDVVQAMLATCDQTLAGKRDRALLALGFGGAFRRSELVALTVENLEVTDEGIKVRVAKSKTDQGAAGQVVPVLDGPRLAVKASLTAWLSAAGITAGPVFRSLGKGGRVSTNALSDRSVAAIVKARAQQAGLDASRFSGHSLRAGFLTSAAASGASVWKMAEVSRHRRIETLRTYVRSAESFTAHAGLQFM